MRSFIKSTEHDHRAGFGQPALVAANIDHIVEYARVAGEVSRGKHPVGVGARVPRGRLAQDGIVRQARILRISSHKQRVAIDKRPRAFRPVVVRLELRLREKAVGKLYRTIAVVSALVFSVVMTLSPFCFLGFKLYYAIF